MINAGILTFHEFVMGETLPLATLQAGVLEFLKQRDDAILFGAQAVNAWVNEPRMTQDIDLLSNRAADLAEELRIWLAERFQIAVRIREVKAGLDRIYQLQKSGNRHLINIRAVATLPPAERIEQVLVLTPPALIAQKVIAFYQRRGKPKSGTDWRDIAMLLLAFPELKVDAGQVTQQLIAANASSEILTVWQDLVHQTIQPVEEDDDF
ncbi:nucleotidyl transferase AbiEii/AbiGii toxin family protein [Nodosilinea sp. LEGE 07298]|uniref:nucleotidyl transferase AbiEii/AbiGii toxin family protein n=1 Tax=Nodosilinea sp. LEGE 07298 TaxID=2777970 RepID=UPI00188095EB|nr:nucleotidyl transferase AbiEii/AbiGii toxin family protein [Nodosilinea sp. LEGE 07298]MBE9107879.1 nucleotidyl transferase AbiEii/AbiGii toxin family protein [Nodosilinea sp. LEGE 07298]